jgi:hypothetical protein
LESIQAPVSPLSPPNVSDDIESISNRLTPEQKVGGSLIEAISSTTYKLAPAAALLATAVTVMKKKSRLSRKRNKKAKRSTKRH